MELSAPVVSDLRALSTALDEPGLDLETLLRRLGETCRLAVSSCVGFSVRLVVQSIPIDFAVLDELGPSEPIVASLMLPLSTLTAGSEPGSTLTLYAVTPGAFVDLSADVSFALELGPGVVELDAHLAPSPTAIGRTGLEQLSARNHAIGILLGRGLDLDVAAAALDRLAEERHATADVAARWLIAAAVRGEAPEPT